jgi:DNA polymerase (family 10)
MSNAEVARVFLRIAEIMSYREESTFKVRAYDRAALILSALDEPLAEVAARGELETLPGIGEAIAGKIGEILQTGTCALYERLQTEVPESVRLLLRVPGLTPRLVRLLEREFDVRSVEAFRALAASGGLADLEGTTVKVEDAAQMLRAAEELGVFEAMGRDGVYDA